MSHFREMVEQQLPLAEAYLDNGKKLLERHRARVAERKRRGWPSREAATLLRLMEATHELHVRHVAILQRDLDRTDYRPPTPYRPPENEAPPKRQPY